MVSQKVYDLCLPVLSDEALEEEEKTEHLEELLAREPVSLKGKALEDAVLGALWQWKGTTDKSAASPPVRGFAATGALARTRSPASWVQRTATPASATSSPRPSSALPVRGPLARTASSSASPFSSPRPSPRLPVATPSIPHGSPRLSAYQPSSSPPPSVEHYGDYGSDTVDWLVNDDDVSSTTSFGDAGSAPAPDFISSYNVEMSPYDMLRSVLQKSSTDEELEQVLEANGYDLGQTMNAIMFNPDIIPASSPPRDAPRTYLVGKSMSPTLRPLTPAAQQKSSVVCRYWLASGHCARADCRYAHEVQNSHVCKYWLQGNCFAGIHCLFSHDPSELMGKVSIAGTGTSTPQHLPPSVQLQDYDGFPALQPATSNPYDDTSGSGLPKTTLNANLYIPTGPRQGSRSNSRPGSRHSSRGPAQFQPNLQDDEAFPTLGTAAASKPLGKRHHGKRGGHGNHATNITAQPANLAENSREALRRGLRNNRSFTSSRENSSQATIIPPPVEIPWLQTGEKANEAYLSARQEAIAHGTARNRLLQSAAQAWHRNDGGRAKALSLRGQEENEKMRGAHREAARLIYEQRNTSGMEGRELYIDLHGLHPEEAVRYLSGCLAEQKSLSRPVYAICGTNHHSKNLGKDKVGKEVRRYLNERRYVFREFSAPGERHGQGGLIGIDPASSLGLGDGVDSGIGLEND